MTWAIRLPQPIEAVQSQQYGVIVDMHPQVIKKKFSRPKKNYNG